MKRFIRKIILGGLILLFIWQILYLWLGDMSGHIFMGEDYEANANVVLYPKQIWVNTNRTVHKLQGNNEIYDLRYRLIQEVTDNIKKNKVKEERIVSNDYATLLSSTNGIMYEYGLPLALDEILLSKDYKADVTNIKNVYIAENASSSKFTDIYLISADDTIQKKLVAHSELTLNKKIYDYYLGIENTGADKEENNYRASILNNDSNNFLEKNIFLAIADYENGINYNLVEFAIDEEIVDKHGVDNYTSDLFKNPNMISKIVDADKILYSDNLSTTVKYYNNGVIEYMKTTSNNDAVAKLTSAQQLEVVLSFINKSKSIPLGLKNGLYLKDITKIDGGNRYTFGYQVDNVDVKFSDNFKAEIGADEFLTLDAKNNEIVGGKWVMYSPIVNYDRVFEYHVATDEAMNTGIEDIYQQMEMQRIQVPDNLEVKIVDMECVYEVEELNTTASFVWTITSEIYDDSEDRKIVEVIYK